MEKDIQSIIMAEIGLDKDFEWYNGSSSCEYRRMKAVNLLPEAIQKYHNVGENIDYPNKDLIKTLQTVALKSEKDACDLTNTWTAVSRVIYEHIYQANESYEERNKSYKSLNDFLRKVYSVD